MSASVGSSWKKDLNRVRSTSSVEVAKHEIWVGGRADGRRGERKRNLNPNRNGAQIGIGPSPIATK